jgi:hypothetical protein
MNTIQFQPLLVPAAASPAPEDRAGADCMVCGFEPATSDDERFKDFERDQRRGNLLHAIDARRGDGERRYSSHLVIEQAAERFFELVAVAEDRLHGRFTDDEFLAIANSTCTPIWNWNRHTSVASMVANDRGIDSIDDLKKGSPLRLLLEKLVELTPVENAALVDVCERVWRGHDNPLL